MNKKFIFKLLLFFTFCLSAAFVCVFFGAVSINAVDFFRSLLTVEPVDELTWHIIVKHRIPRIILAFLVGGGLAVAGAVFQALLRNPLATPHTLGVSSGGALGASAGILFGVSGWAIPFVTPVQLFSLIGSLGVVIIIYLLAREKERFSTMRLLLAGVTIALISSAMIMFIRYLVDPHKLVVLDRWLMGGLDVLGYDALISILPIYLPAIILLFLDSNRLNQMVFGEELAAGRGVNVRAVQIRIFLVGSALTSCMVSVAGPIGFVGLIIPHALRMIVGSDHRILLLTSFFGGGMFLTVADTVARSAFSPSELPVGVLTAMLGGPFFLYLLLNKKCGAF